jgi:predicted esterase
VNAIQTSSQDPHHGQPVTSEGEPLESASGAMILIHGRGASAADILPLAREVGGPGLAYLAPQADGNTWYPYSFLMPMEQNEPYLSSALAKVGSVLEMVTGAGISGDRIVLLGFSQGACLASEFVARNARRYGGLIVFSGGVIGPDGTPRDYAGSLDDTPVFLGCSDVDAHIPESRVRETGAVFERLGGKVDLRIYPGMGHTINRDELEAAQSLVQSIEPAGRVAEGGS